MTIMVGTLEVEEVRASQLAPGDHVVMGDGSSQYPIRSIEIAEPGLLRLRVGCLRPGILIEDLGTIPTEPWRIIRRVCR